MSEAKSKIDLERIISPFKILNSSCSFVWTPLVDDEIDGEFNSVVTGKPAKYLPWNEDQPSGGDEENNVAVLVENELYFDRDKSSHFCTACDVKKTTVFSLIGVCEDSHLGYFLGRGVELTYI